MARARAAFMTGFIGLFYGRGIKLDAPRETEPQVWFVRDLREVVNLANELALEDFAEFFGGHAKVYAN